MKSNKSFLDYIKNNPLIIAAWISGIFIGLVSLIDRVYVVTFFMLFVVLTTLIAGIIDWKRNG
jgi:hypothetical protein